MVSRWLHGGLRLWLDDYLRSVVSTWESGSVVASCMWFSTSSELDSAHVLGRLVVRQ